MSKRIVPIVEGDGDAKAVPVLLRQVLHSLLEEYTWEVARPKKAHSLAFLRKNIERYLYYAQMEPDSGAILILMDLDDGCPKLEAQELAERIRRLAPRVPVAVVLAHREYEAWLLASIETIVRQRSDLFSAAFVKDPKVPDDVESIRDAKGWISGRMRGNQKYKETVHQAGMTALIEHRLAAQRSRSFRRFLNAVSALVRHSGDVAFVSPSRAVGGDGGARFDGLGARRAGSLGRRSSDPRSLARLYWFSGNWTKGLCGIGNVSAVCCHVLNGPVVL